MILVYGHYPFPSIVRGGWLRRIAAVDALLASRPRCYVFPGQPGDPLDYRLHQQDSVRNERLPKDVRFFRPDLRLAAHCRRLTALVDEAEFVYAHTSHSAQHLLPYYRTGKIITDVHGIAPEEERMQGSPGRARFYESFEETMVRESATLVTVTQTMADHFRRKYPGLTTPFIHLPILEEIAAPASLQRPPRQRLRVVYAGGVQRWQNPDLMVASAAKTKDRYEFTFCTHQREELDRLLVHHGARDGVQLTCLEPAQLSALYAQQDLGFVLRDDDPVNRVSCPTKLTEYLAHGVVPIVSCAEIGDFASMGYRYVSLADFLADKIPDHDTLNEMRQHNYGIYERVRQAYATGMEALRNLRAPTPKPALHSHPGLFLTALERSTLPLDGVRLEVGWNDGQQASFAIDAAFHSGSRSVVLPPDATPSRSLCRLRLSPGPGPFVTSPMTVRVVDAGANEHRIAVSGNHNVDRFGNWVFLERDAWVEASGFDVQHAREVRLDYEVLLEGPETWMAMGQHAEHRPKLTQTATSSLVVPLVCPPAVMVTDNRRRCLFRHIDVHDKRGLEVGPYCNPTVAKSEGDIRYLDFYSRSELLAKEADRRTASDVVADVDYVVKTDQYHLDIPDTFDYVVANHVLEHVDNPVQWVIDLGRLLRDDGVLFLAVPDKKYNFDRFRSDTTLAHLLTDYFRGGGEPREHGMDIWIHYDTTYVGQPLDLDAKLDLARLRAAYDEQPHPGRHNHVFESETFVRSVLRPLQMIGLWQYTLLEFAGAEHNHGEFYVVLRKGGEAVRLRPADFFAPLAAVESTPEPPAAAQAELSACRAEIVQLHADLAAARAESAALRESFSWRLTRPGRSMAGVLASLRWRR